MSRRILLGALAVGAITGLAVIGGGYNVSASSGHWGPVASLMHWTMQNSVAWRAPALPARPTADGKLAGRGAVHYDLVCRDCHGAPGQALTAVPASMTPAPPHILDSLPAWQPQELFWIIKHGVKMTAMPAWPAQERDDEVWAMVAFLQRLPGISAEEYQRLVQGPAHGDGATGTDSEFDRTLRECARCHDDDGGAGSVAGVPRIDGLSPEYVEHTLRAYAGGRRASGIMQAQASALTPELMRALARHYAAPSPNQVRRRVRQTPPSAGNPDRPWRKGQRIARLGVPERDVPACAACHGPNSYDPSPAYPSLAGQDRQYLTSQLELFRAGHRGGTRFAALMTRAAEPLSDDEIAQLALYYSEPDASQLMSGERY